MASSLPAATDVTVLENVIRDHVRYSVGLRLQEATPDDIFHAVVLAIRRIILDRIFDTEGRYAQQDAKRLYYLSLEFLVGRSLCNSLHNLGLHEASRRALSNLGVSLERIEAEENDAALGNGGLGRLAACFLDSLASLDMPGYGYGLLYDYGLFKQVLQNGYQIERPDHWRGSESPWMIERKNQACLVPLYGKIEHGVDLEGNYNPMWLGWKFIVGIPYDLPIVGYGGQTVNSLRLFTARSSEEFDVQIFNEGDYIQAVEDKIASESVSKVLYPSDDVTAGKQLRLVQEYFLVACAMRDIVRRFKKNHSDFFLFPSKVAIQLNDTHPALTVAELMRILVDENSIDWDTAWEITQATCGYTNHTLLPEALERWPVPMFESTLPRHLQIIYEINHRFLEGVRQRFPGDRDRVRRLSIIEEGAEKQIRMAHLAILGSHSVNGVAAMHSELIKKRLVPDFFELFPEKFNNKTNGVTHRRWLMLANPSLAGLITDAIGEGWITDAEELRGLEPYAADSEFQQRFRAAKQANKERLARHVYEYSRLTLDGASLFDVQAKRMHEYKRQLLNAMHIIHQYLSLVEDGQTLPVPRTYLMAGKAAPGYYIAKLVIKLIANLAEVINADSKARDQMKVVFVPDFRVSSGEMIYPAADLSEQISTAGTEASGTGNMKFAMNGALTIGTLDGANVEILEEVGTENIYIFGLTVKQVAAQQQNRSYHPWEYYRGNPAIRRVLDAINGDRFCPKEPGLFRPLFDRLLEQGDPYFHLADFENYVATQQRVSHDYLDESGWTRRAILNVARLGKFSSDRTVREYAQQIWGLQPVLP